MLKMEKWQEDIAFQAEEAAHLCFACGQHGHYPNECPRKLRPQVAAPKEKPSTLFAVGFMWFVIGIIVGMTIIRGLS